MIRTNLLYKITAGLLLMCSIITLASCNDEDDVNAIFSNKTWYLANFYSTKDWDDVNAGNPVYTDNETLQLINGNGTGRLYIIFQEDGTFKARGVSNDFSGTWDVDGKKRTFRLSITNGGRPSGNQLADKISQEFYDYCKATEEGGYYEGSIHYIRVAKPEKNYYMLLNRDRQSK